MQLEIYREQWVWMREQNQHPFNSQEKEDMPCSPLLPKSAYIDGLGFGFFPKIRTMVAWVVSENERFKGHIYPSMKLQMLTCTLKNSEFFWRWCFNVSYVLQNITCFVIQMVNRSYLCTQSSVFDFSSLISFIFCDLWCRQFLFKFFCWWNFLFKMISYFLRVDLSFDKWSHQINIREFFFLFYRYYCRVKYHDIDISLIHGMWGQWIRVGSNWCAGLI